MRISQALRDQIVAHAREQAPNECCGMVATQDGHAVRVYRAINAAASPLRYEVDGDDVFRITTEIEDRGWGLGAIYHSHTRSAPYPSQTDINLAFLGDSEDPLWPDAIYLIVGVATADAELRGFRIPARDRVEQVELEIEQ